MNKDQLRERLLAAGVDSEAIDQRLSTITEAQLKEYAELPLAVELKESSQGGDSDSSALLYLAPDTLQAFQVTVAKAMTDILEAMEIEIDDSDSGATVTKEIAHQLKEWDDRMLNIEAALAHLLQDDEVRLKEMITPAARSRLILHKSASPKKRMPAAMSDDDDDEDEDDEELTVQEKEQVARWLQRERKERRNGGGDTIRDGSGNVYSSMTEMFTGGTN